jgi:hypothetical protein
MMLEDFEGALLKMFGQPYADLEQRGHDRLGPSKPLAARYAVERLARNAESPGWEEVRRLATTIRLELVGATGGPSDAGGQGTTAL